MSRPPAYPILAFLGAYAAFIVAGSLWPFHDWAPLAGWSAQFLYAPPPRYITRHDLTTNLLLYLPLGYALVLALHRASPRVLAILAASLIGGGLSFAMEGLQQLLPSRIASNLDIFINTLGSFIGALLALHHGRWLRAWAAFRRWRSNWFQPHGVATPGLWLLLLWGLTQFSLLPFPAVDWLGLHLRPIDTPPDRFTQINFAWLLAVFMEMATVGAYAATLLKPGRYASAILLLFLSGFLLKLFAAAVLLRLKVMGGILSLETIAAFVLAIWVLLLPAVSRHRRATAIIFLVAVAFGRLVFVSAPFWPSGSLLNIVGMAAHVAALWPWLALAQLWWSSNRSAQPKARDCKGSPS